MTAVKCKIAEVCVFSAGETGPRFLLLKRSPGEKLYPGIWQFVSGGIRENEKAYAAALRELAEETGLKVKRFYRVPHVTVFYDAEEDAVHHVPLFAAETEREDEPVLSNEHETHRWCASDEALGLLVWPGQREGLKTVLEYIAGNPEAGRLSDISHKQT